MTDILPGNAKAKSHLFRLGSIIFEQHYVCRV